MVCKMIRAYPEDILDQNQNNREIRVVYIPVVENQNHNFDKLLIFGMLVIATVVCLTILFKK